MKAIWFLKRENFSALALHSSLPPWPHLVLVSRPRALELVAPLSYLNLHKILVFQGKGVDIREYP